MAAGGIPFQLVEGDRGHVRTTLTRCSCRGESGSGHSVLLYLGYRGGRSRNLKRASISSSVKRAS